MESTKLSSEVCTQVIYFKFLFHDFQLLTFRQMPGLVPACAAQTPITVVPAFAEGGIEMAITCAAACEKLVFCPDVS